jgi:hypothetical protein
VDIKFNQQEAGFLELSTKRQSSSTLWYDRRLVRITASMFGRVVRCRLTTYQTSIVKTIMQYTCPSPDIPLLKRGRDSENLARKEYRIFMEQEHVILLTVPAGVHRLPLYRNTIVILIGISS